jgi:hypothetical protein
MAPEMSEHVMELADEIGEIFQDYTVEDVLIVCISFAADGIRQIADTKEATTLEIFEHVAQSLRRLLVADQ